MSDFLSVLAVALISPSAALAGVWLSSHRDVERQKSAMRADELVAQRNLVVEIIVAGTEWAASQELVLPMIWKGAIKDMVKFTETETGTRLGQVRDELRVAITRASVGLANAELRTIVAGLADFVSKVPDEVVGPVMASGADADTVGRSLGRIAWFRRELDRLEQRAAVVLGNPIWE